MNAIETVRIGDDMPRLGMVAPDTSWGDVRGVVVSWVAGPRRDKVEFIDLAPALFTYKLYQPLRCDRDLFRTVHVIDDGAAIAWGDDDAIDMAATTVERLAEEAMQAADFSEWLKRNGLTFEAAAASLGISRRLVAYYASGGKEVPRYIALACRYVDQLREPRSGTLASTLAMTAKPFEKMVVQEIVVQETEEPFLAHRVEERPDVGVQDVAHLGAGDPIQETTWPRETIKAGRDERS